MITAMDDQIGKVIEALERKGMRDSTIIVFQSDNGGPRSAKFTGEVDMSESVIPADNGPYRDGKASLYEGGTRVAALANWPGRIPTGTVVDQPLHIVDMYPTLVRLAGGSLAQNKPLDGLDVWATISEGAPSPRGEVIYGIEPFRGAVRVGDWKLVWQATLPSRIELFNLGQDPGEAADLAAENPDVVADLQGRIEAEARSAVPPLIFSEAMASLKPALFGSVRFPDEAEVVESQP
jgi:arylsulfatase A-like enzyme